MIIYLILALLPDSSELLLTEFRYEPIFCFVLAPSKDLAVALLHFCKINPEGSHCLSALASLFAPRTLL